MSRTPFLGTLPRHSPSTMPMCPLARSSRLASIENLLLPARYSCSAWIATLACGPEPDADRASVASVSAWRSVGRGSAGDSAAAVVTTHARTRGAGGQRACVVPQRIADAMRLSRLGGGCACCCLGSSRAQPTRSPARRRTGVPDHADRRPTMGAACKRVIASSCRCPPKRTRPDRTRPRTSHA